jgi:uncharacterized protein YyaL (SSP411 family)
MKKTHDLNMAREYRDELKTLRKNRRKVVRDAKKATGDLARKIKALERAHRRGGRAAQKTLALIDRRMAILEGRLS